MHWWQIGIRLLLIANVWGNVSEAIRAGRGRHWERLHWLLPNTFGWAILFFDLLPARWGGVGLNHWQIAVWGSIVLLLYGMIMKITDVSSPSFPFTSFDVPHLGYMGPQHMVVIPIFGFLLVGWDILQKHHVSSRDGVLVVGFSLGLVFGVRLCLRQLSLTRLRDLAELSKPKPRARRKEPEKYWMGSRKE